MPPEPQFRHDRSKSAVSLQTRRRTHGYHDDVLIRFEASNFRSIADTVELSLVAVDRDRREARYQEMLGTSLLPVAAVYGPNASGKSNLIAAMAWVRDAVDFSLRRWEDEIPIEPFAFGLGPTKPSEFCIELVVQGVRFEYVLEVDSRAVLYEGLFHYPEKKRRRIFEREGNELKLQRGLGGITGTRELLTERTLALSAARRFGEPLINDFTRDLLRIQTLGSTARRPRRFGYSPLMGRSTQRWFEGNSQPSLDDDEVEPRELKRRDELRQRDRDQALALLRLADLGIDDVVLDTEEVRFPDTDEVRTVRRIRLVHLASEERTPLELYAESEGTQTWFRLIGPILSALRAGTIVMYDELDASLHPTLSAQLIHLFHDPTTNPLGAQLVFTSHDTSLLNHLNRDEVWLTEKGKTGATRLGALAVFAGERVRKSQNLEDGYLHGRFGAVPHLDQVELLRALGLIG